MCDICGEHLNIFYFIIVNSEKLKVCTSCYQKMNEKINSLKLPKRCLFCGGAISINEHNIYEDGIFEKEMYTKEYYTLLQSCKPCTDKFFNHLKIDVVLEKNII